MNGARPAVTNGGSNAVLDPSKPSLSVCVLSAYDLPVRDPPLYVGISVGDNSPVKIGPPSQRHKDRNSFKFPREPAKLQARSLPELYQETAIVKVVYPNTAHNMTAEYSLNQLKLHETVWIILQLEQQGDIDADAVPPTLRLQLTLHGPYRPEIGFVVNLFENWFQTVDRMESTASGVLSKLPDAKFLWIPAAPILGMTVVTAPILAGVAVVTLPVAVPVIVLLLGILGCLVASGCFVYASTKQGRSAVAGVLGPAVQTVVATKAGQTALYQTGPRPTPVSICRVVLPDGFIGKLLVSLMIDAIGSSSYLVPIVGEITDLGWAPIQMMLIMAMYEGESARQDLEWLKYVSFMEEILPFTDICPTATLGWFIQCGIPHWFGKDVATTLESVLATAVPKQTTMQPKRSAPTATPVPAFKDEVIA